MVSTHGFTFVNLPLAGSHVALPPPVNVEVQITFTSSFDFPRNVIVVFAVTLSLVSTTRSAHGFGVHPLREYTLVSVRSQV